MVEPTHLKKKYSSNWIISPGKGENNKSWNHQLVNDGFHVGKYTVRPMDAKGKVRFSQKSTRWIPLGLWIGMIGNPCNPWVILAQDHSRLSGRFDVQGMCVFPFFFCQKNTLGIYYLYIAGTEKGLQHLVNLAS